MKALLLSLFSVTALAQAPSFPPLEDDFDDDGPPIDVPQVSSVDAFEPALAPYGTWVSIEGQRAFQPSVALVGPDFVPYASQGQWVSTQAGWSFSTSLPFGWATYHYGRWWFDQTRGWLWLPDTVWGPAWVDWRDGGGYLGWAPLPPPRFASYRPSWFFVRSGVFGSPNVMRYGVPRGQHDAIFGLTISVPSRRYRGNTWYSGPAYRDVARFGGEPQQRPTSAFGPPPEVRASIRPRVFVREVPPPPAVHWSRPWPVGSSGWPNRGIAPAVRQPQNVHQAVPVGPPPPRSGVHQAQPVGPPPSRGGGRQRR